MLNIKLPAARVALALLLLMPPHAYSQEENVRQLSAAVRAQLQARNPDGALEALQRLEKLSAARPPDYELLFLQGATWQELAARGKSVDRAQAVERAKQAYMEALRIRPGAPAVFNNLGALHAAAGDDKAAEEWYRKAIDAGDARKGFYALNYARTLEWRDPKSALQLAQVALKDAPGSEEVLAFVGTLAGRLNDGDAFLRLLTESASQGQTKLVTALALRDLTAVASGSGAAKSHVLATLAFALSKDHAALAAQPTTELVDGLRRVAGDADASTGAQQLARVFVEPSSSAGDLRWWNRERIRVLDRTRASVMRELLIALGVERAERRPHEAEGLLMSAIELGDYGPDPDAFLRLVEFYVNRQRVPALQALMRRYERDLFGGKSNAYQRNDLQLIYRMHLALGMTYAHLNVWASESPFQNAKFQLESANRAAQRFNAQAKTSGSADRLAMPPSAVFKLSEAYAAAGQRDLATRLRIESAKELAAVKRTIDAADVYRTIPRNDVLRLDPISRETYRAVGSAVLKD